MIVRRRANADVPGGEHRHDGSRCPEIKADLIETKRTAAAQAQAVASVSEQTTFLRASRVFQKEPLIIVNQNRAAADVELGFGRGGADAYIGVGGCPVYAVDAAQNHRITLRDSGIRADSCGVGQIARSYIR